MFGVAEIDLLHFQFPDSIIHTGPQIHAQLRFFFVARDLGEEVQVFKETFLRLYNFIHVPEFT